LPCTQYNTIQYNTIQYEKYDTIRKKSLTWTQKLSELVTRTMPVSWQWHSIITQYNTLNIPYSEVVFNC